MGTPEFAVESLKALTDSNFNITAVVTNPDKPAGRGRKISESPVKQFAKKKGFKILQPNNLREKTFIEELNSLKPDLQVVVAFKILPPEVFTIPKKGTFNLHASLLPDYRGAAPINHAIINGEKKTGVTTFFLDEKVDTGKIINQKAVVISKEDTAGSLHDKLMKKGSKLVVESTEKIMRNQYKTVDQKQLLNDKTKVKKAPKIFKKDCQINWQKPVNEVHNFIRGLSPHPAAWTKLINTETYSAKIYAGYPEKSTFSETPGSIITDSKKRLKVACQNGYLHIQEIQIAGKKRMKTEEFLRGFQKISEYRFE